MWHKNLKIKVPSISVGQLPLSQQIGIKITNIEVPWNQNNFCFTQMPQLDGSMLV